MPRGRAPRTPGRRPSRRRRSPSRSASGARITAAAASSGVAVFDRLARRQAARIASGRATAARIPARPRALRSAVVVVSPRCRPVGAGGLGARGGRSCGSPSSNGSFRPGWSCGRAYDRSRRMADGRRHRYSSLRPKRAKHERPRRGVRVEKSGGVLLSQGVYPQVPSALAVLTSVFGMGTGVTLPL